MTTDRSPARRIRLGFRARVLGTLAALVIGAVGIGVLIQRSVLLQRFDDAVDDSLQQERDELVRLSTEIDPATGAPFGTDVDAIFTAFLARNQPSTGEAFFTFVDGEVGLSTPAPVRLDLDPTVGRQWATVTDSEWGVIDTTAGPVRYLAVPVEIVAADGTSTIGGVFVVANFVRDQRNEIESTVLVTLAIIGSIVALGVLIAWLVAGRLLRPVQELTEAAETITETDLSRRIPVSGGDEIARLGVQFNAMLDRLEASFASQRAFVDDAGHELRTPITIVRGHLELMGDDPQDQRETIALVTDELDRMARIVDDLLLLAKAEQPDFVTERPVELTDFTSEVVVKARALGTREWVLDESAEVTASLDPHRMTQALLNLARNAVEHSANGSTIHLGSTVRGGEIVFWVHDEGRGIAALDHDRIFDRFARVGTGARRSDGAGLGLAIVRSVAVAHGGRVELDSALGAGARFSVILPGWRIARPAGAQPSWPAPTAEASI